MQRRLLILLFIVVVVIVTIQFVFYSKKKSLQSFQISSKNTEWAAPDSNDIPLNKEGNLIRYGKELIINTSYYFGPSGILGIKSNGMNCQNCHREGGTKMYGNNFSMVANNYPRFKDRSGAIETINKKVQDCFERSLNGYAIDSTGKEMKAFVAYLKWIGSNAPKNTKVPGSGIEELHFMERAADSAKGKMVYTLKCQACHGKNGEGLLTKSSISYVNPPLWGPNAYNIGASIYRLSKFAGYVKNNMPLGATYEKPQLTDEEAWDVAAFVNSQPHEYKNIDADWPIISTKPYDYPFGPYPDNQFSEKDHKYGPFAPIKKNYTNLNKKN